MALSGLSLAGGIGSGVSAGLQDIRAQQEADQMRQMRALQINDMQQKQALQQKVAGLPAVGTMVDDGTGVPVSDTGVAPTGQAALAGQTGASGVQGTGTPSNVKPYTAAMQARDIANAAASVGEYDIAAQHSDRATQLEQQEYAQKVNYLRSIGRTMPLQDYAAAAAHVFSENPTPYKAYVNPDSSGQLTGTVFDSQGRSVNVPVTSHDDIDNMLYASTNPDAWMATKKLAIDQAHLGIQGRMAGAAETTAGAAATTAKAHADTVLAQNNSGYWQSIVNDNIQKAKMYPAQAAYFNAHANQANAMATRMNAMANDLDNKLTGAQKAHYDILRTELSGAQKMWQDDPKNPALQERVNGLLFQNNKFLQGQDPAGLADMDIYAASHIPTPDAAAANMLGDKRLPKPNELQQAVSHLGDVYGHDYAADVQTSLKTRMDAMQAAKATRPSNALPPSATAGIPSSPPGGFQLPPEQEAVGQEIDSLNNQISDLQKNAPGLRQQSALKNWQAQMDGLKARLQDAKSRYNPTIPPAGATPLGPSLRALQPQ